MIVLNCEHRFITLSVIVLLLLTCPGNLAFGQNSGNCSITGIVVDSIGQEPVDMASVALYRLSDNSLVAGTITDATGKFSINNLPGGKFILRSSFVGYKTQQMIVEILSSSVILSNPILLNRSSQKLHEVQITGKQSEKLVTIEKTKINVAQNMSAVSGTLTEVLKSLPSVTIDAENNMYLRGSSNILILVDGRPTTMGSINSIPASGIESVEIITNPDAKYDAEGTGGIINIVLKKQGTAGTSGMVTLNFGVYHRLNGGVNFNMRRGIWDISFNFNEKYEKTDINSNLTRQLSSQSFWIEQAIHSIQTSPSHVGSISISASPSETSHYSFGLKVMVPSVSNVQTIYGSLIQDSLPEVDFNRRNEITFSRKVIENSLSYRKILQKNRQEISCDVAFSRMQGSRPAEYYLENRLLQKSAGGGAPTNITAQLDHFKFLTGSGRIETGIRAFSRWNSFDYAFYDLDTLTGTWMPNPRFSNDLEHKEFIYSGYVMYSDSLFKKLHYKVGVRLEYNTSELIQKSISETINSDYLFPFPYLLIKHSINKNQSIAFSINRRISRPTYPQLNPFINVIDQMTYETGNKNLVPEIADKAEFSHTWLRPKVQFRSTVYISTLTNFITQVTTLSSPGELFITYVNGSRMNKAGADVDAVVKISKVISLNPGFSVFYTNSQGAYNGIDLGVSNLAWSGSVKATIKPDLKTDIQVIINYNSPVALPQFNLREIYFADVAVKRSYLKDRLMISLTLTDLFNTRRWIIQSENALFKLENSSKTDTRILWLGLTYNFNSFKPSNSQKADADESNNGLIKLGNN